MSISSIGGAAGTSGSVYNFTNVTNSDFQQEIQALKTRGALSPDQSVLLTLDAEGGDSVPVNGPSLSTSQALDDTTARNFISIFQTQDAWMHGTSGSVGTALVDSIVQTLNAYQGRPSDTSSSSISAQA